MASRSSSPSPGQSGQDDRDDDADSATGQNLPHIHDESLDSDCEAVANRPNSRNDNEEDEADSGIVGNSSNVTIATSDQVSSGIMHNPRSFNEAQPGSSSMSSSSYFSSNPSQRGNVSGSFQVMMMADDDDDDDEDEAEARAIAESRHMFAASSSNNNLRRSPYLSSSTSAFRGSSSSNNEETIDMATFSPQPSSSGLNIVPTTSGVSSANVSTNDPNVLVKAGISSSSSSNPNQLSSSADVKNDRQNTSDSQVTESQKSLHGEISNPPSPLGGHNNSSRNNSAQQRPDSPQAGPSGVKRPLVSDSASSSSSTANAGSKQRRRQSFESSQPGPSSGIAVQRPQPHRSGQPLTFMAAAAAALHPAAGPSSAAAGPSSTFMAAAAAALQNQSSPRIGPSAGPSNYSARPSAGPSTPRVAPQAPIINLNVSSSEAIPIDNGSDDDDDYGHVGPNLRPPHTPADHYLISSSTGVNDSIPATPVDVHGDGDLSVPSPSVPGLRHNPNPLNDVDDMIDSTVDSTGYSSVQMNQEQSGRSNDSNEGPVQSSHYEDSSDDDEGPAQGSGLSRQHSLAMESGISTSGQVDEGQFRLVPNNIEDDQYNQYHPPTRSPRNEARLANVSSSSASSNIPMNNSESSSSASRANQAASLGQPGSSRDLPANHIFCEPGPSKPRPSSVVHNNGNNGTNNLRQRRNNGLDYELDALDNFPDHPVSDQGDDFDPSNSLSSSFPPIDSHPVDLEDIQVQNLVPEGVDNSSNNAAAASSNAQSTLNKYLNNNAAMTTKNHDLASSASLGNISLAFSRIPGKAPSSSDKAASSSSSSSNVNINNHSSILESMTGPLSKRLRTLHSLQQQQNNEALPQFKVNGNGKKSSNSEKAKPNSSNSKNSNNDQGASTSSSVHRSYDPEQDDDNAGGGNGNASSSSSSSASGLSGGHNIQTYSVTIETEGNPIKPKKFFQQKSEESVVDHIKEPLFNVIHPLSDEKSNSLALNRSRRHIKKRQMHYCDQCRMEYESECLLHQPVLMQITDQPIMSRAQASLPSGYLSLRQTSSDDEFQEGIFARKTIPKNCRFGPVEGDELPLATFDDINDDEEVAFVVVHDAGHLIRLDVSDENNSNWMRFVRPADRYSEQNLIVSQDGGQLYFSSTRTINPRQELRVWYSPDYAEARGLRVHHPSPEDQALEDDINTWPCFECSQGYPSSDELQKHLNEHENIAPPNGMLNSKRVKVILPQKDSSVKGGSGSADKRYKCPICPRVFERQYSVQRHIALHKGDKKYKCDECNARYSLRFNLNRHKRRVHNNDPKGHHTRCEVCGLWFRVNATFRIHCYSHLKNQKVVTSEDDLKCPQCCEKFLYWSDHVAHAATHGERMLPLQPLEASSPHATITTHHPRKSSTHGHHSTTENLRKPHKCEFCYKSFSTEDRLTKHMAVHGSDENKPLACQECGKRFLSNSALACHLKVHAIENFSYDCPICRQPFDQIHALKEHVHVHRINNVYTCPHCLKEFPEYALIRKHIRAFHAEKRFRCVHCDKAFTGSDKLKAHLVKHSDKREFLCNECGKTFKRKDKLQEHAKRIHSQERKARNLAAAQAAQIQAQQAPNAPEASGAPFVINEDISGNNNNDKFVPRVSPTDYHRFIYKCHKCLLGFKRRGMLVNHLAKRHPDIPLETVPELNLPILKTTKDYFCQYCNKVYKSSSKRKSHILKNHPGKEPPPSARDKAALEKAASQQQQPSIRAVESSGQAIQQNFNPTYSATVGSVTSQPHNCPFCHKQYATNAKLLQHQRKDHPQEPLVPSQYSNIKPSKTASESDSGMRIVSVMDNDGNENNLSWPAAVESNNSNLLEHQIASPGPQQPAAAQPPSNLEYRLDGEVLQLTRVAQDEALRLVNSGATVIHVAATDEQEPLPGPSRASIPTAAQGAGPEPQQQMVVFSPQQVQHQGSNTAVAASTSASTAGASSGTTHGHPTQNRALNPNYDHLPAELVQVLVNQQSEQQHQMLPPPPPAPPVQQQHQARHHHQQQQQSQSRNQDTDWINAYRHRQQ